MNKVLVTWIGFVWGQHSDFVSTYGCFSLAGQAAGFPEPKGPCKSPHRQGQLCPKLRSQLLGAFLNLSKSSWKLEQSQTTASEPNGCATHGL